MNYFEFHLGDASDLAALQMRHFTAAELLAVTHVSARELLLIEVHTFGQDELVQIFALTRAV